MAILILAFLFVLSGCMFNRLKKDMQEQGRLVTVTGRVIDEAPRQADKGLVAVIIETGDVLNPKLKNFTRLDANGTFSWRVPPGRYRVFAFEDTGGQRVYSPEARTGRSAPIEASVPGSTIRVNVTIPRRRDIAASSQASRIQASIGGDSIALPFRNIGAVTTLDNPAFSPENIQTGLWEPYKFVTSVPMGIFLLEEYDRHKVPVLFIHGISGAPTNFRRLIAGLDKTHCQPLVFYYPSGFRIHMIAGYLDKTLGQLCHTAGFRDLVIVAHSMGGLVARDFINMAATAKRKYRIKAFISISTPWAGHSAARAGVKYAPAVVPAWIDLAPGSPFLAGLFDTPLPPGMTRVLAFSYKGDSMFTSGNNDGVVSLASQLRMEAQEESDIVRGFNRTHMGILEDPALAALINRTLKQALE